MGSMNLRGVNRAVVPEAIGLATRGIADKGRSEERTDGPEWYEKFLYSAVRLRYRSALYANATARLCATVR